MFTRAIGVNICLYAMLVALPMLDHNWLNEEQMDVLSWNGYAAAIEVPVAAWRGFTVVWFAIMFGLVLRFGWARPALLIWLSVSLGLNAVGGMITLTPAETTLSSAGYILDGVVLALAYASPVANDFKPSQRDP